MLPETAVRLAAALPSSTPHRGPMIGAAEVESCRRRPRSLPRRQAGGVEAVLEVEAVRPAGWRTGAARRPEPPLLAGVGDVEAGDRGAGVVGERSPDRRRQRAGQQRRRRPAPWRWRRRSCRCHRRCRSRCRARTASLLLAPVPVSRRYQPPGSVVFVGPAVFGEAVEVLGCGRADRCQRDRAGAGRWCRRRRERDEHRRRQCGRESARRRAPPACHQMSPESSPSRASRARPRGPGTLTPRRRTWQARQVNLRRTTRKPPLLEPGSPVASQDELRRQFWNGPKSKSSRATGWLALPNS